ncbi:MAG: GNAT family N-acetyltransferase [Anaerolineales bacterium]|nr:GNAT family N-acetyltransferase [Anaerolineales bacterium]MCB8939401.1 GNAT family N-acetyltransferase [Ardenticatenaceae bacterium]
MATQSENQIEYRHGTAADDYDTFLIFEETLADLVRRLGFTGEMSWGDEANLAKMWQARRPLYEHLRQTAVQFWVAQQNNKTVGFSRSILHDGVLELTELFVKPGTQSGGLGRGLIERAFTNEDASNRIIIATSDFRAQALYLKAGVFPRFPIYFFDRTPEPVPFASDLQFVPLQNEPETVAMLGEIDQDVIGYRRAADQRWFLANRQGFLYVRNGRPVGYGYVGENSGPFALLDAADFPAVLAHAESTAHAAGQTEFGVEVPMVNETAVTYLLSRHYKIDVFMAMFMSERPLGHYDRYLVTSPPFFV